MKKTSKKKTTGSVKSLIGVLVALVLTVFLFNPNWLPVSSETKTAFAELEKAHFLIEGSGKITLAHLLGLVLAVCLLALFYTLIKLILNAIGKKNTRARTVTALIAGIVKYLAVIVGIIWGLSILGVNSTAVLAGIGIIGLILGFAAQSLIEDIITGLFIIFEGKYTIGDIIILDDFRGVVREIGVRTTTIEDAGKNLKVVNNSDIRNFQNRSRNTSLASCEVSVSYDADLRRVEQILVDSMPDMYLAHPDLYLSQPRFLGFTKLGDNGVDLKLVVETKEEDVFDAQRMLVKDVRLLFADKGIEIPFPQVVVHSGN